MRRGGEGVGKDGDIRAFCTALHGQPVRSFQPTLRRSLQLTNHTHQRALTDSR